MALHRWIHMQLSLKYYPLISIVWDIESDLPFIGCRQLLLFQSDSAIASMVERLQFLKFLEIVPQWPSMLIRVKKRRMLTPNQHQKYGRDKSLLWVHTSLLGS